MKENNLTGEKTSIVDFFDVYNADHLRAWRHLEQVGSWPEGFVPENTEFPPSWRFVIMQRGLDAWIKKTSRGEVLGFPSFELMKVG